MLILFFKGEANLRDRRMLLRDLLEFLSICTSDTREEDAIAAIEVLKDSFDHFKGL